MAAIHLITASADRAREHARRTRRGYWADALVLAVEKYGLLDVELHDHHDLDVDALAAADVVLVAHAAGGSWSSELLAFTTSGAGEVIAEGPLPREIEEHLGVRSQPAGRLGSLAVTDSELRAGCERYGEFVGGHVNVGRWDLDNRHPEMDWTSLDVPISPERAAAWHVAGWDVRQWARFESPGCAELVSWVEADDTTRRSPALVSREGVVGCSFGLFEFLGQSHTSQPADGPRTRKWPRSAGTEALLLALIDRACSRRGRVRARVMPWPAGYSWALTVRHDVDRSIGVEDVAAIIERHRAVGTAATWYWRSRHLGTKEGVAAIRAVSGSADHEVAHHTERLWADDEAERHAVESAVGEPVHGTCAHGDPACFRWQGAPNVLRAASLGYRYTEMISHAHLTPHRFATLQESWDVEPLDVICLPHHESFDRGTKPGETHVAQLPAPIERFRLAGGCLQLLNHPDIHRAEFFEFVATLSTAGRLDWTAREIADWWAATHVLGALRARCDEAGVVEVEAQTSIRGS